MRYLLCVVLATVLFCGGCSDDNQSCDESHNDIEDADDMDALKHCTTLNRLTIENTELTSLYFPNLVTVKGHVFVQENDDLGSIDMSSLEKVDQSFFIGSNDDLDSLDLDDLAEVGEEFVITFNKSLDSLDLGNLAEVGDYLKISFNESLTSLDGGDLEWVPNLTIMGNTALPDCEACELLDQFSELPIYVIVHDNLDDSCTPVPDNCP